VGGVAAGAKLAMSGRVTASDAGNAAEMPQVALGRTGEKVSQMGTGCGHLWKPNVPDGEPRKILLRGLELGVNYIDVAPNYGNEERGYSEELIGPTVKEIRDKIFLVTKTEEASYEGTWNLLRQSMRRLQTDYLDLVHLHNIGLESRFPDLELALGDKGALGALQEAKEKGVVRFIGASGHLNPSRFHAVLDTGKIDVLMNAVNFIVQHTYGFEHKVWSRARQEDLGLVAMKVLGGAFGGKGFRIPEEHYDKAIRYAVSIPGVHVAVIGVENVAELEKAARAVATAQPLSETEAHELARIGLELAGTDRWQTAYGTPVT
jgi:aryl-alcohol dehydrogenase-like predicted oxidoreductase